MNLAPAFAARHSGDSSLQTEIALLPRGYAGAVLPLNPSLPETDVLRPVVLGSGGLGSVAAPRETARVAEWQEGDLSARGARSRQWGLESPEGRTAKAGATRGTD
jgi:hypothetical protein